MKNNEFKCAVCGGVFEKALTEEETKEQLMKEFGDYDVEECDIVCGYCFYGRKGLYLKNITN